MIINKKKGFKANIHIKKAGRGVCVWGRGENKQKCIYYCYEVYNDTISTILFQVLDKLFSKHLQQL
jgi:hypothetical protein